MDNKSLCPDIISSGCEYYDDQISGSDSWELFSSLSSLRRAALLWYPVSKSACALDLGCGFGALTGVLCDKAGHVVAADPDPVCAEGTEKRYSRRPGLSVLCAGAEEALKGRTFDLILVQDIERICSGPDRLFELIKDHLSAEGRLLIMFRNRLGIGYACGRTDEKVPEPGAAMASGSGLHAAGELEEKLKKAGFEDLRRYYLYPDRYFTQAVFSDEFMPSGCISDRVLTYDPFGTGSAARAAAEHRQLDMLAAEGLLGKMANDVLLECFLPGAARAGKHVTGAYISADREAPNAFCTVFLSGGTVEKRPVFAEGAQTLRSAAENISELSARGIETVPHSLTEDAGGAVLAMPFADGTPMLDALSALLAEDAEGAKALLRQLWEDILRFSEHCLDQSEKFAFSDGPVLKKGCVDMIPLNAFVKDGKVYLTYSGGSANRYTYALGLLTADTESDLSDPRSWTKSIVPVLTFRSVEGEYGPGHNSFFVSDDGDLLIAYHAETGLKETLRCDGIRRVHFRPDGTPYFGMSAAEDLTRASVASRILIG